MESGIAYFMKSLWNGYSLNVDGALLQYLLTIIILAAVFFRIRKDHTRVDTLTKLIWITGVWGTLYGLCLTYMAVGNPALPKEHFEYMKASGISASMTQLVLAAFGAFIVDLMDLFIAKEPKA